MHETIDIDVITIAMKKNRDKTYNFKKLRMGITI
jgi:hypothetical protein